MEDDYLNENTDEIIRRYEQYLSGESSGYFDVEEFETIAEHYLRQGHTKDSYRALDLGMRLHPTSSELLLKRAKTFLASGEINKALEILEMQTDSDYYESKLLKIEAFSKLNRKKEAELIISHLIEQNENDLDAICLDVAFIYLAQGKNDFAMYYLELGYTENTKNLDLLFELAYGYELNEKTTNAIAIYNQIITIDPYISEAWFNLGQLYFSLQEYTKSLEAFDFCIAIDEKDSLAWLQKAHVYFYLLDFPNSIDACENFKKLYGEKWEVDFFIAESYERMQEYENAIEYYLKTIKVNPEFTESYACVGLCLLELERYQESLTYFENALKLDPTQSDFFVYIAEAYSGMDNFSEALNAYKKALEKKPDQANTWVAMGNVQMDMGEYHDALTSYLFAYDKNKELEYIELLLAVAYAKNQMYENMFLYLNKLAENGENEVETFFEMCPEIVEILSHLIEKKQS